MHIHILQITFLHVIALLRGPIKGTTLGCQPAPGCKPDPGFYPCLACLKDAYHTSTPCLIALNPNKSACILKRRAILLIQPAKTILLILLIEIKHKKKSPTHILSTLGWLWLCDSEANKPLIISAACHGIGSKFCLGLIGQKSMPQFFFLRRLRGRPSIAGQKKLVIFSCFPVT